MERMSVVLPLPEGPSSPVIRPAAMSSANPSSTVARPRATVSPSIEIELFVTR